MCDSEEVRHLWLAQKTVYQMMKERGFGVSESELALTIDEFRKAYPTLITTGSRNSLSMLFQHLHDASNQLFVFFPDSAYFKSKDIKTYIETLGKQNISNGIIVCRETLKSHSMKAIEEARKEYNLEVFYVRELLFNVTHHRDVPQHILLSREEKEDLLRERKIPEDKLRKIPLTDPVTRYYGGKRGQVFRIVRNSETAGKSIDYRIIE